MTLRTCESCGANLDPCEICDCTEKAAADGDNIDSGNMESNLDTKLPQKGGEVNA